MISIPGYKVAEAVISTPTVALLRAERLSDGHLVLLKIPLLEPTACSIQELTNDYEVNTYFNSPTILKAYDKFTVGSMTFLEMEHFAGVALEHYMQRPLALSQLISISIAITEHLELFHAHGFLHSDIRPLHYLIEPDTLRVVVYDFRFARKLSKGNKTDIFERKLSLAPQFLSPEQTGRMDMEEDHRADLYSFGVTLYLFFTGKLPFEQLDINELVHAHLAKQPLLPHETNKELPTMLSDIISKLLQKKPEERYQSARALKHDLMECLNQLNCYGQIHAFTPCAYEMSDVFNTSSCLYGRQKEINRVLDAFESISAKSEWIWLQGGSGVGKSALVKEVARRLQKRNVLFLSSKCDQNKQNVPFGVIADALNGLVKHWKNHEKEEEVRKQVDFVLQEMGSSVEILSPLLPDLPTLSGKQPSPILPLVGAQKRLALSLSTFLQLIATPERPLLLFLDDLHWADSASLQFLDLLMETTESKNRLVIGAYREAHLSSSPQLVNITNRAIGNLAGERHLFLSPLSLGDLSELLADTLGSHPTLTLPLADHLLVRTLGNPLFVHETIFQLYKKGLFVFNAPFRKWDWSLDAIQHYANTHSSLDLITKKIQALSKTTQQALIYAACIGQPFDLYMLSALLDKSDHDVADELKEAVQENLLHIERQLATQQAKGVLPRTSYRFLHDQVQQAACSLVTFQEKQEIHLAIGYFMLDRFSADEVEKRIFEITNHFNVAKGVLDGEQHKHKVALLNFQAGNKAKRTTAYGVAYSYYEEGLSLVNNATWTSDYTFCYLLHLHCAEMAYLNHKCRRVEELVDRMLRHAATPLERIAVHEMKIRALVYKQMNKEAVHYGLSVLKSVGITFPGSYSVANVLMAYAKTKWMLRGKKPEDLEQLPSMVEARKLCAMRIIQSITASSYHAMPELYPLLILKMVALSVKYGNSPESTLAYVTYGAIVNAIETNNMVCFQFGNMAVRLLQRYNDIGIRERTLLIYHLINRTSGEHLHGSLEELKRCYKIGIEQGDHEYAVYTSNGYGMLLCLSGKNLRGVKEEIIRCNLVPPALNQAHTTNDNEALIQYVANLLDESSDPKVLDGAYFSESIMFTTPVMMSQPSRLFVCYIFKMHLCYLVDDYSEGLKNELHALRHMDSSRGMILEPVFYFYAALLHLAQYKTNFRTYHLRKARCYKNKLKKWADQVPINHLHRYLLVEADYWAATGKQNQALVFFDKAIKQAKESQYLQDEALAHELVARYWKEKGQKQAAVIYLASALDGYKKWGCLLKVRQLEASLSTQNETASFELPPYDFQKPLVGQLSPSLDMATILKASTALSSEVVFDKLLEKLMKFVIENAGAQAGYFIIDWGGKLVIEARQSVDDHKSLKLKLLLEETELVPRTLIQHVFNYRNDVVLHDARVNNPFSEDPTIVKNQIRSALCIPAVNQGKLVGALYLENNLVSGAFTQDRVELLKLLSGQIAVSIENSILYENLEQKVQERTMEIQVQKEEIEKQKQLVEEKSKFKEQFFANMSHEIRTPMTAIIGMSELLFDTSLTSKQMEYAKGIKYSSDNLLAIINDILDYAKIESGKFTFVSKPFQMRDRMTRLTYIVKQMAEEKGIALSVVIDPSIPEQLIGDPLRLHQILLNLVSNAIKFTEQGTVSLSVEQRSANESSVVLVFVVRDTGRGIAEEKLHYIFETFSRIEDELNVPGTGLGLFIAKKLVEEQGGSLSVASKVKEGTAFQFTLPFQRSHVLVSDEEAQDDDVMSGTRILLVEDTLFNQIVAEEILRKIIHNPQVIIAGNGQVALEKLEEHTVDIILMDIKMPVMDGYTASKEIRLRKDLEKVPILAFTSNANPGEAEKCKTAGMDDYITKPIESKKLKQKIAKLLQIKKEAWVF